MSKLIQFNLFLIHTCVGIGYDARIFVRDVNFLSVERVKSHENILVCCYLQGFI